MIVNGVAQSQLKLGCVSGCSKGLVIHWDVNTGACINEFGIYSSVVLQLESTVAIMMGLFSEGCLRVWDIVSGDLTRTITLVRPTSANYIHISNAVWSSIVYKHKHWFSHTTVP